MVFNLFHNFYSFVFLSLFLNLFPVNFYSNNSIFSGYRAGDILADAAVYLQPVAGTGVNGYNGDNQPSLAAQINFSPYGGVWSDSNGRVYIGDADNYRFRRVDVGGIIATVAGTGSDGSSGTSGVATSTAIHWPWFVTGDTVGTNVYFTDYNYVWKFQVASNIVTRFAGITPVAAGFAGDGQQATAATFNKIRGVTINTNGNVYISEEANHRIRWVATTGIINTFAGNGGAGTFTGDGNQATAAGLNKPHGMYMNTNGLFFFSDFGNSRVRTVDSSGVIRTFAGGGAGGDGVQATAASLSAISYDVKGDSLGNIYIADNCKVRLVETSGIISTYAGTGTCAHTLTFAPALSNLQQVCIPLILIFSHLLCFLRCDRCLLILIEMFIFFKPLGLSLKL
jgi:hypothetical protein